MLPKKILYYSCLFLFIIIITGIFLFVNYHNANAFISSINYWFLLNEILYKFQLDFFEYLYYNFPKIYFYISLLIILIPIYCFKSFLSKKLSIFDVFLLLMVDFIVAIGWIFPFELFNYPQILFLLEYYFVGLSIFVFVLNICISYRLAESILNFIIKFSKKIYQKIRL